MGLPRLRHTTDRVKGKPYLCIVIKKQENMGLDINFFKAKRTEWNRFQNELSAYESLPENVQNRGNNPYNSFSPEEVGYFRKVNFLMSFFDYYGNCEYKEITRERLQALHNACAEIVKMKPVRSEVTKYIYGGVKEVRVYSDADQKRCAELLPTQSGFFFGSTDYDQWYFDDVKEVFVWLDGVLSDLDDDEVILMYCWW